MAKVISNSPGTASVLTSFGGRTFMVIPLPTVSIEGILTEDDHVILTESSDPITEES